MNYMPLNFALMANPWNWAVIALMVAMFGFGVSLLQQLSSMPASEPPK
jgi:hypothetical protein